MYTDWGLGGYVPYVCFVGPIIVLPTVGSKFDSGFFVSLIKPRLVLFTDNFDFFELYVISFDCLRPAHTTECGH